MATFPTLTPSSRKFTPGRHPHSEIFGLGGTQTRVRTSNVLLDQRLRLTFVALTEAQMLDIRTHYNTQQGQFIPFEIPASLLSGMAVPASFTPTGYSWIYAGSPEVENIGLQRYTVTVELVTIPYGGATVNGTELTVPVSLTTGAGTGLPLTNGANLTVTTSLQSGVATGETFLNVPAATIEIAPVAPTYIGETQAPSYLGAGAYSLGRTSITTPWPAGHQAGDLAIYWASSSQFNGGFGHPSGWTAIAAPEVAAWEKFWVSYKYATSSSEPDVVRSPGSYQTCAQIIVIRNVAASSPIDAQNSTAFLPSAPFNPLNVTTTGPKRFVLTLQRWGAGYYAQPTNWTTVASVGSGFTTLVDYENSSNDSFNHPRGIINVIGGTQSTTGLTPQIVLTHNNTFYSELYAYLVTIALKPQ